MTVKEETKKRAAEILVQFSGGEPGAMLRALAERCAHAEVQIVELLEEVHSLKVQGSKEKK